MMLIVAILVIFCFLVASEAWWRTHTYHSEISRKFIHITVGCFVAALPFFISWKQIIILSLAFILGVSLSLYFNIFQAIHAVERPTWGELCFGAAVGILAIFVRSPLLYTISLLHMGLADGLAALVGTAYGKTNNYKVFGHRKSIAGSIAFFVVSLTLLIIYATLIPSAIPATYIVLLALVATALENFAIRGLDNLFVPVLVAGALLLVS
jgi:phytol kinase